MDVRREVRKERIERCPRGRIDCDERARDERYRQKDSDHRSDGPPATPNDIDRRVPNQGHSGFSNPPPSMTHIINKHIEKQFTGEAGWKVGTLRDCTPGSDARRVG